MKNLKIRTKLFLLVGFALIILCALGASAVNFMGQINNSSTIIASNWLPSVIVAEELNTLTSDYRIQEYAHVVSTDAATMKERETELSKLSGQIQNYLAEYNTLITNDTDAAMIKNATDIWNAYLTLSNQMLTASRENNTQLALNTLQGDSKTAFDEVSRVFKEVVEFNTTGADAASEDGDQLYAFASTMMIVIIVVAVILLIIGAIIIIRFITKPVSEIDNVARSIADGDLNQAITYESKDELGALAVNFNKTVVRLRDYVKYIDEIASVLNEIATGNLVFTLTYDYAGEFAKIKDALNHISNSLNETMSEINQSSEQVSSGSEQVSSGAQALSQGATEQASSVEELAATINEMTNQITETAQNALNADKEANAVAQEATESNERMQNMLSAMEDISESSKKISKIIKDIEDIAFQTNILALNAAVEAARAGAAGKGFAVVADEVRNLASKSAEASKNTAALIEGSLRAVENGTKIANETAGSLENVVTGIATVNNTVAKISEASNIQAQSASQISQGIDQISSVVQTNSATAEESAAASEELSGQAQILKGLVDRFKLKDATGYSGSAEAQRASINDTVQQIERPSFDNSSKY